MKPIDAEDAEDLMTKSDDVQFSGNNELWKVLVKAWSDEDEWVDTTMAMQIGNGVLIRSTYQSADESVCSESSVFVPNVKLQKDTNGNYFVG